MNYSLYIGIDPGYGGGAAILYAEDLKPAIVIDTPTFTTPVRKKIRGNWTTVNKQNYLVHEMAHALFPFSSIETVAFTIEQVSPMPNEGSVSSFHFGRGVGLWEGMSYGLDFDFYSVRPQEWKSYYPEFRSVKQSYLEEIGVKNISKVSTVEQERINRAVKQRAKKLARKIASELFPHLADEFQKSKDDGKADAILIANYIRERDKSNELVQSDKDSND